VAQRKFTRREVCVVVYISLTPLQCNARFGSVTVAVHLRRNNNACVSRPSPAGAHYRRSWRTNFHRRDGAHFRPTRSLVPVITVIVLVAGVMTNLNVISNAAPASAFSTTPPLLTQSGSIFENDDSTSGVNADSVQAAGNTAITNVRAGERVTLRTQLTNTGGALTSTTPLSLFYDHGDGNWSKVGPAGSTPTTGSGNCTSTTFDCSTLDSAVGYDPNSATAVDSTGAPWVAYIDHPDGYLKVMKKVGSGGNCSSGVWQCTTVANPGNVGNNVSIGITSAGVPWISYYLTGAKDLYVAHYVGSGGTGCATATWSCTAVDTTNDSGWFNSLAIDNSGTPWVSYVNATSGALRVAHYVTSGGSGCSSTAWTCTTIDSTVSADNGTSITIDSANHPWISYVDDTSGYLRVAQYLGSGGNCTSTAWKCTTVDNQNSAGWYSSIGTAPDGSIYVSYGADTHSQVRLAHNVSGTGCTSTAWTCTTIESGDSLGENSSIGFDPSGQPEVAYIDDSNYHLMLATKAVTTSTGCGVTGWNCTTIDSGDDDDPSIAFASDGTTYISYGTSPTSTTGAIKIATTHNANEITLGNGLAGANGDSLTSSHSDMTTATDSTNKADADCLVSGSTWNNGKWFTANNPTGEAIAAGSSTKQCSEVAFVLDTTNAQANTTYRFALATQDSFRPDKYSWRGPIAVSNYPQLTTATSTTSRVSKQAVSTLPTTAADLTTHLDAGSSPRTASTPCTEGYCAIASKDGITDPQTATSGQYPINQITSTSSTNTSLPSISWIGQSTAAPSTNNLTIQVYKFGTTNAWQTITPSVNSCNSAAANTSCAIEGTATGTASDYYTGSSGNYVMYERAYQAAGAETLKTDALSSSLIPIPLPTPSFTESPTTADTGTAINVNASGSTPASGTTISDYGWNFGDGNTATGVTASHSYATAGTYTITLTVTDSDGGSAQTTKTVTIDNTPTAAFTAMPSSSDVGQTINFNSSGSTASGSSITGYSWNFGDGNTSTVANPTHVYSTAGSYNVTLTVTDGNGGTGSVGHAVTQYGLPTAAFTETPSTTEIDHVVSFNSGGSTASGSSITGYSWNFGDGSTSTAANPNHAYGTAGTYTVTLTVTDGNGGTGTVSHTVTILNGPTASFTETPTSGTVPLVVNFNASGSTAPTGGTITGYSWDFGDGTTSTAENPSHTYTIAGNYTVTLVITDSYGGTDMKTNMVSAAAIPPPTASFTATPASTEIDHNVNFNSTASTPGSGATITGYMWDFGDGSTSTVANPSHAYAASGTYTVTLTVTDSDGQHSSMTQTVTIYNAPTASFTENPTAGEAPLNVSFDGTGSSADHATITGYSWDFGDGNTDTSATPTHTYSTAGTYTVTLTVTDSNGGTGQTSQTVKATTGSSYADSVENDGAIRYYRADESSGTVANDSSPSHVNGTYGPYGNPPTLDASGALLGDSDTALGSGQITAPNSGLPAGDTARTLETWYKFGYYPYDIMGYDGIDVQETNGGYGRGIDVFDNSGALLASATTVYPLGDNNWHLIDVTYDGTTLKIYIDGQLFGSGTASINSDLSGKSFFANAGTGLDEVAVYPNVLSPSQVNEHWSIGQTPSGSSCKSAPTTGYAGLVTGESPSVYYRLDEVTSDGKTRLAYDSSGNCNNGTLSPGATPEAGALNGDSDQAISNQQLYASATSLPQGHASRTLEAWYKFGTYPFDIMGYDGIDVQETNNGYGRGIDVFDNSGNLLARATTVYPLGDNNWHLIDVTYDGTTLKVYIDGQLFGSGVATINSNGLAKSFFANAGTGLDEVAVYPSVLSGTQIDAHWTSGQSPTETACKSAPTTGYAGSITGEHPSVYYRMDDATSDGTTRLAYDSSGNCNNGTMSPGATPEAGALNSDSDSALSNQQLYASATSLPQGHASRTLEAWYKFGTYPYDIMGYDGIDIQETNSGYGRGIDVMDNSGTLLARGSTTYPLGDNNWHLVDVTYDGSTLKVYVDGQLSGSGTASIDSNGLAKSFFANAGSGLDEVAVYPSVLSASQIDAHWTSGQGTGTACLAPSSSDYSTVIKIDKPTSYYRLGDAGATGTARVAYDSSGNCNNAALNPGAAPVAGAIVGDPDTGINGYVRASTTALPSGNQPRTLETWWRFNDWPDDIMGYDGIHVEQDGYPGYGSGINIQDDSGHVLLDAPTQNHLGDNAWHLIDVTFDGSMATIYVDGQAISSGNISIGSSSTSPFYANSGTGLDETAVYNSALPADHIYLHYIVGEYAGLIGGAINLREIVAGGNFCYACLANALSQIAASHGQFGDPVDTTFGTVSEQAADISIKGRGEPLAQIRSYDSGMSTDDGPLGYGWKDDYNAHLTVDPGSGNVVVSQEDGSEVPFINSSGTYAPAAPRFQATLTHNGDATWTMVRNATETLTFNTLGQLTSQADVNGITTNLTYDGSGNLATVTDAEGHTLTFTWTGSHITAVTDNSGRVVHYAYDGNGNLSSVTEPDGGVYTYTYDSNHHILTVLDPNQDGSANPHPTINVYDPTSGKVISQTDPLGRTTTFSYNADGSDVVTDPAGHETYELYQYGLRTEVTYGYGTSSATTWHYAYDPRTAELVASYVEAPGDPNDHATSSTYDAQGHMLSSTDGDGRTTTYTYDSLGDVLTETAPNPSTVGPAEITTTNTYDANGNLLTTTRPLYTSSSSHTDQTITYHRDIAGKPDLVSSVTDPEGKTTMMDYNAIGQLQSTTSPEGRVTSYTYDSVGRTATEVYPKGNAGTPSDYTTTYSYDAMDRVLSTSVANGATPEVTSNTYDKDGNLMTSTDADGRVTGYVYDLANEQTTVNRPDGTSLSMTYFPDGEIHQQIDGSGQATTYAEDPLGRVANSTDPLSRTTSYTYDGAGNVLTSTNPSGQVTTDLYDNAGELVTTSYSDGTTPNVSITYGPAGNKTSEADGSGTQSWNYDSLGELTSQTDGVGTTVTYGYDIRGELTSIGYPGTSHVVNRTYGDDGEMTDVTDWNSNNTHFSYDPDMNMVGTLYGNGVTATNTYDNAGNVTNISYKRGIRTLATYGYQRSTGGDVTGETDSGTSAGSNETYTYNTLGQLASENGGDYTYDSADNLTATPDGSTLGYDHANEVTTKTAPDSTVTTYGYDLQGNRTSETTGASTTNLGYDQANRLTSYGTNATYQYDGGGLRTEKTVNGTTNDFTYDTAEGLPLLVNDDNDYYIYGPDGTPIEQTDGSTVEYLHQDQLGSTRLITDSGGNVIGTYQYDAYGNTTSQTGSVTTPLQYAGQYKDVESGLYWMRARYYDPSTESFVSRDPAAAVTQSPYSYGDGDPIDGTDPSGLCFHNPFGHDTCQSIWKEHPIIRDGLIGVAAVALVVAAAPVVLPVLGGAGATLFEAETGGLGTAAFGAAMGGPAAAGGALALGSSLGVGASVLGAGIYGIYGIYQLSKNSNSPVNTGGRCLLNGANIPGQPTKVSLKDKLGSIFLSGTGVGSDPSSSYPEDNKAEPPELPRSFSR
jgi:RHS repeat-associated protein